MKREWRKWHWKTAILAVIAALLVAAAIPVATQEKPYPELDEQLQLLRNQFNADVGRVRLLLILDPT